MSYHIGIIGGGITALSTAWSLYQQGCQPHILMKKRLFSATQAAGGMLSPSCEVDGCSEELIELSVKSCAMYPDWIKEIEALSGLSCEYQSTGTLLIANHHDHMQELMHLEKFQHKYGLQTQWLTRQEIREWEPNLTRYVGGLFCPNDHQVHPRTLYNALYGALKKCNIAFSEYDNLEIGFDGRQVKNLLLNEKPQTFDHYVICDGTWSKDLLDIPMRPVKGQYVILEGEPLIQRVIRSPNVYMIPRKNQLFLGATMEEEGFNTQNTAGAILDLLYHAFQILPGVYELKMVEQGVGFRPAMRDNQPLMGHSTFENLWWNTGHYRHGIMLAPAAAALFTEHLLYNSQIPAIFQSSRFKAH